ncbi:MAG: glycerate kinase [Clostridia bacterium]|nr:glycerate kinase [Clostridia bacterium]
MKVVVAIDSFKGSMSSMEAGNAAKEGILKAHPDANVVVKPLADGGEGTVEALVEGFGGTYEFVKVSGPLGAEVNARYGTMQGGKTAIMEMAEAGGIILVDRNALDPWRASTVGVGQMIKNAVEKGCRDFIVGIGGSATTEGGIGMLSALGFEFFDADGNLLEPVFESLAKVARISGEKVMPELDECHFQVACDVKNPLCGENGCVYVYGPQKGVKPEERQPMDEMMAKFAEVVKNFVGEDYSNMPGAGAAGGLGFAFRSFFKNVELRPGISIVLDAIELEKELADADVVVTGEGRLDSQTANGKVPVGVAKLAKKYDCRVVAMAGSVTDDADACNNAGIDAFFPILRGISTLDEAMDNSTAKKNISLTAEQVFRLM